MMRVEGLMGIAVVISGEGKIHWKLYFPVEKLKALALQVEERALCNFEERRGRSSGMRSIRYAME